MKKLSLALVALFLSLSLTAQNTITTDTILQLSTCAGGNVLVPFSTSGTLPPGTTYTAQLSDAFGQFTNPINIGSVPLNLGFIFTTIPASTNFGFLYKIRVVTSSVIGSSCPNTLIITQVAQLNQIIVAPNDSICQGESATLTALVPGGTYAWSTGETTQSITVNQSGNYSVTVNDPLQCETDTSVTITVFPQPCNVGISDVDGLSFSISPNPNSGIFQSNFANNEIKAENITVVNALGQNVHFAINSIGESSFQMSLMGIENGVYFLKIDKDKHTSMKRIVKQ